MQTRLLKMETQFQIVNAFATSQNAFAKVRTRWQHMKKRLREWVRVCGNCNAFAKKNATADNGVALAKGKTRSPKMGTRLQIRERVCESANAFA